MTNLRNLRDEDGQAIIEAALLLPVFVLIAFGLCDIQWCLSRASNVEYIAQEVARCQAIRGAACAAPATPQDYAARLGGNLRMDLSRLSATGACNPGVSCRAEVTYRYKPMGVWFPAITIQRVGEAAIAGS